jgi:DNA-binding NtrC family response regulator
LLPAGFETFFTGDIASAKQYLLKDIDVLICDIAFDEMRAFELLEHMQSLSEHIEILCVHCGNVSLDTSAEAVIAFMARHAGASSFINLGTRASQ